MFGFPVGLQMHPMFLGGGGGQIIMLPVGGGAFVQMAYEHPEERLCQQTVTLYHQTSPENAERILQSQTMIKGTSGMAGGGIYFAASPHDTNHKAKHTGCILRAEVILGNVLRLPKNGLSHITYEWLQERGYDSVQIPRDNGTEYVVYHSSQVVRISRY